MEFMAEWKALWPIASTFSAPLLIPNNDPKTPFGPLTFTPSASFSTTILHAPSLSPRLPPPYPQLTLSRFLQSYSSIPSSATSISSFLGPQLPNCSSEYHGFNSLQLLQIPNKNLIIAFFPAGENSDRVGFSLISVKDGVLGVHSRRENFFHILEEGNVNRQRITCLLVNPVDDFCCNEKGDGIFTKNNNVVAAVGFLMVCRKYSVYWYRVGINSTDKQNENSVCLDCVGSTNAKMLMGKPIACACWSPHLTGDCLVLLESGELLLFDVNYFSGRKANSMFLGSGYNGFVNKKVQVPLSDKLGLKEESVSEGRQWFGCDFSWHPRIFIVCHRNEILLVDSRSSGECNVCCLLKLEMLSLGKNDRFFSLSRAGSDGFYFVVATRYLLLLCDVRKPFIPVLRWAHTVRNPRYMSVFRLPELRANAKETEYKLASESGYCVILGSFWDNNFSLFCYGPDDNGDGSVRTEISKFCNSYYAWGFPSELSLSGSDCKCGSCLVREEFWKSSLPVWTDWRHKKELILGFGILKPDLSAQLSSFGSFGGFTLIRLTSSGKLEAQNYLAAWGSDKLSEAGHKRKSIQLKDSLLYDYDYSEYDGVKKFQHLKLELLNAFLKDKLATLIVKRREKIKESDIKAQRKYAGKSKLNIHQEICRRLKAFGFSIMESPFNSSVVLKNISWPTSIHEIALKSACAALPANLLQLAFSSYLDFEEDLENQKEPLEFLDIPDQLQAPPFPFRKPSHRSNKWSTKVQPSDAIVGSILPTHFLTTLHKLCEDELKEERELYREESEAFSAHTQFNFLCDKVVEVVREHISGSDVKIRDDFVSLADDTEDMSYQTQKLNFSCYNPSAFLESPLRMGIWKSGCENYTFSNYVFRRSQELACDLSEGIVGKELFDEGCPMELNFDDHTIDFGPMELEIFRTLKKQDLEFQRYFKPYQDYIIRRDEAK
ncbi:hypothetical protein C2S53_002443 [Perilla frutescens var. hirtella]|uniref:Uncharacterized protein n=1 Tax=Perilla frutescens var. hirtella TaxID=608512 RepID=A0AAD4NY50_PERFH|nr:hypothetical protein C2S53_002443 [Perilla frutescens var. hirtella]